MKKVLVVFGSKSDKSVFEPIVKSQKEKKADVDMRICSAHRTPALLNSILLEKQYDLVIAGAGLAAHLPGVVASKTPVPVIGVPCNGAFDGLDSFLSIVQMPPGIPVLGVGVDVNPVNDFLLKEKQIEIMDESLQILGEPCNTIIIDFYINKLSMQEIADKMGYTNNENAKNQKYKCLQRLKKIYFKNYNISSE